MRRGTPERHPWIRLAGLVSLLLLASAAFPVTVAAQDDARLDPATPESRLHILINAHRERVGCLALA